MAIAPLALSPSSALESMMSHMSSCSSASCGVFNVPRLPHPEPASPVGSVLFTESLDLAQGELLRLDTPRRLGEQQEVFLTGQGQVGKAPFRLRLSRDNEDCSTLGLDLR